MVEDLRKFLRADQFRMTEQIAFSTSGSRYGVLIEVKGYSEPRWKKFQFAIYPTDEQTLADVYKMLADIREEAIRG